jgi:adenylate kinase family enzyme
LLLLIFGMPGSGKTHFIRALSEQFPNVTVYEDQMVNVLNPDNNDDLFTRADIERHLINVGPVVVTFHASQLVSELQGKHLEFWMERFKVSILHTRNAPEILNW